MLRVFYLYTQLQRSVQNSTIRVRNTDILSVNGYGVRRQTTHYRLCRCAIHCHTYTQTQSRRQAERRTVAVSVFRFIFVHRKRLTGVYAIGSTIVAPFISHTFLTPPLLLLICTIVQLDTQTQYCIRLCWHTRLFRFIFHDLISFSSPSRIYNEISEITLNSFINGKDGGIHNTDMST